MTEAQQQHRIIGYVNPACTNPSPPVKPPNQRMLKFARDICSVLNIPLPKECEESYDACYRFIGDNLDEFYSKKPKKQATASAPANYKGAA